MIESNIVRHDIPPQRPAVIGDARGAFATAIVLLLATTLSGCASVAYFGQAISGHLHLMQQRRGIDALLAESVPSDPLHARLEAVDDILAFARDTLLLPTGGNYRTFVQLDAAYVAWNVFAAPPFSLSARRWCYPVAGCLTYRGYFSETAARDEARRLQSAGEDVFVGGVTAYSTLGWFDDPLLSSMLRGEKLDLAALLFHELAHGKFWIRGDTDLNEAFAEAVARIGTELAARVWNDVDLDGYRARMRHEDEFYALVLRHKRELQLHYGSGRPEAELQDLKQRQFDSLRADYQELKSASGDPGRFDPWFEDGLNNAKLAAVSAYRELVPGLLEVYRRSGSEPGEFYRQVERLTRCPPGPRREWVLAGGSGPSCAATAAVR